MPTLFVVLLLHDLLARDLVAGVLTRAGAEVESAADETELRTLVQQRDATVVLMDLDERQAPRERLVVDLLREGARVLLVADGAPGASLLGALLAGASGQLRLADTSPDQLVSTVRSVAEGEAALNPAVAAAVLEQWRQMRSAAPQARPRAELSARETEILAAVAEGLTTSAIARRLALSPKTVENHKSRIFAKLGVKTQAHAVSVALEQGLIAVPAAP